MVDGYPKMQVWVCGGRVWSKVDKSQKGYWEKSIDGDYPTKLQ